MSEPRGPVEVRVLTENDVEALIACLRRCYGESYTEPEFYDSSYLRAELRARRLFSVGAMVGPRLVGHLGTRMNDQHDFRADKQDIAEVLVRYATGIDRRDWELFRTCFTHDVLAEYDGIDTWTDVDAITAFMASSCCRSSRSDRSPSSVTPTR